MTTIAALWQSIETQYNSGTFPSDQLEKIDNLVFRDDIEDIRNALTLMTTLAPEYLCRYLELDGSSIVLKDAGKFSDPLGAEKVLVKSLKGEPIWQELYESGAFDSMEFRALGDVAIEDLSESEKAFCVRMAKPMVRVPAGEFMMGALEEDEDARSDESPRHKVILTRDFLIGKYQVTQALWENVMGNNPSHFKGANRPVECVSWLDCVLFCNTLSELEGLDAAYIIDGHDVTCNWDAKGYRLPTEAEWEYCARGGEYHKYSGSDNLDEVAWFWDNSDDETHPVGQKKPNGFGLYDMSGNVWEWAWDCMECESTSSLYFTGESLYPNEPVTDPYGASSGGHRCDRGGSWEENSDLVRTSIRGRNAPSDPFSGLGFRIVCALRTESKSVKRQN